MSNVVSFTEICRQHAELLPGRTLLQTVTPGSKGETYILGSTIDDNTVDLRGSGSVDHGDPHGYFIWWY